MKIRIRTAGMKQVKKALEDFSKTLAEELQDEINATALKVEGDAKRLAPVDTGRLRSSIHAVPVKSTDPETGIKTGDLEAAVTTNVDYAPYLEYGTAKQQAKPFLHPAWEGEKNKHIQRIKKIIGKK